MKTKWIRNSKKEIVIGSFIMLLLIILDQVTKMIAEASLQDGSVILIPGVFELSYLRNQSAAFSMDPVTLLNKIFKFQYFIDNPAAFLTYKMVFFYIFTLIISLLIYALFLHLPQGKRFRFMNWICILFVSGAIGNLIDRISHKYVIDFFYFSLINFPIFNVADIYVTVGAFAFIILSIFYYKEEDFSQIFSSKKQKNAES